MFIFSHLTSVSCFIPNAFTKMKYSLGHHLSTGQPGSDVSPWEEPMWWCPPSTIICVKLCGAEGTDSRHQVQQLRTMCLNSMCFKSMCLKSNLWLWVNHFTPVYSEQYMATWWEFSLSKDASWGYACAGIPCILMSRGLADTDPW